MFEPPDKCFGRLVFQRRGSGKTFYAAFPEKAGREKKRRTDRKRKKGKERGRKGKIEKERERRRKKEKERERKRKKEKERESKRKTVSGFTFDVWGRKRYLSANKNRFILD